MTSMIPNDSYKGGKILNCMSSMIKQEGLMSVYKGYGVYSLAILIWMSVLPHATDFLMEKLPLYIDPKSMP